jgi:predicted GTPase
MNPLLQELRTDAARILALLDQGFPYSAGPEERNTLIEETGKVLHKIEAVGQDFLSIGLLGGTGVGKSTIMNALAGSVIASAGHRRPLTHQVLVYKHRETDTLPILGRSDLEWREITHEADAIRQILLFDLPDFDSMAAEHRERVVRFLEHLDLVAWVSSPEKYADLRFYEFLDTVPKARPNFLFVLNKVDLLFEGTDPVEAYDRLARTVGLFRKHLNDHGVDDPPLFAVSAQADPARGGSEPWNQFPLLKQHVFRQRDIKEIHCVRSANLDVELRGIASVLEKEARPLQSVEEYIGSSLVQMETRKPIWRNEAGEAVSRWIGRHWETVLLQGSGRSALIGPGRAIELLLSEWREAIRPEKNLPVETPSPHPPESVLSLFRAQVEEVKDGITRRMLVQGLPAPLMKRTESVLNPSGRVEAFGRALTGVMNGLLHAPSMPSFRWFKTVQLLTYAVLLLLFLVAIGGGETSEGAAADPGWRSVLKLLVSWIGTLFSTQGLAALGSFLLIHLYLGLRFFRRRRRVVEKAAERAVRKNRDVLMAVWEKEISSLREDLTAYQEDIRSKIGILSQSPRRMPLED